MPYSRILISVDSHECSLTVARKGLELAHILNAKAALLFVVDTAKAMGNVEANILPQQALILLKKETQQTLDQSVSMYSDGDVAKFMPEGHPEEDIIKTAVNPGLVRNNLISIRFEDCLLYHVQENNVAHDFQRHPPLMRLTAL